MYNCIGLDISKELISVYIPKNNLYTEIKNSITGFKSLISKLKKLYKSEFEKIVLIYEPTGNYSDLLTKFCFLKSIRCFIVNPKQSSNFAKSLGERNKTDIVDAKILSKAIVLAKENEIKVPLYNETVEELKELMSYRKFIVKSRVRLSNHLESLVAKNGSSYAISELKKEIKKYKLKESDITSKMLDIIQKDKKLKEGYENIKSIKGIGVESAIALIHLFIKYPDANQREITSLAGLDPIEKSSGSSLKKRPKISKAGSSIYRATLFMGVMSAIRYDNNFKIFFDRLIKNGKHTTVAQIALMRKMICIAHSLYRNNQKFNAKRYARECRRGEEDMVTDG